MENLNDELIVTDSIRVIKALKSQGYGEQLPESRMLRVYEDKKEELLKRCGLI